MNDGRKDTRTEEEQKANMLRRERIRRLNDRLRLTGHGGRTLITPGISELGTEEVSALRQQVAAFAEFSEENDPHGEHDFGALTFRNQKVFWKIDYYNQSLTGGSPDPADPTVTARVLTLMLASEY